MSFTGVSVPTPIALANALPLNVASPVNVETPAIEILSKFVWPSRSKSPFASIYPVNVEIPVTANWPVVVVPTTLSPEDAVVNCKTLLYN